MAIVCLAYLLHLKTELPIEEIRQKFPLAQYSANFWITFAVVAESNDETLQDFIRKFFCNSGSYKNCYSLSFINQIVHGRIIQPKQSRNKNQHYISHRSEV